jgi:hypothetical protein
LAEFTAALEPLEWETDNPYRDASADQVLDTMLGQSKWRYHHGFPALRNTTDFYAPYAQRVDAMLEAIDTALSISGLDLRSSSYIDIAAAEGYVTNHLHARGAREIDAVELNEINIQRMWLVRAAKDIEPGRIGRLDLERVNWSSAIDRVYDVVLALGIVYHMENPMLFLRNLFEITGRAAVVESDTPLFPENQRFRGFGVVYLHRDQVTIGRGSVRHFTEMRPDRQALTEMLLAAGFERVIEIPPAANVRFRMFDTGEKSVLLAMR